MAGVALTVEETKFGRGSGGTGAVRDSLLSRKRLRSHVKSVVALKLVLTK